MTSKLQQYLAESTKTYPFKIGVAGDLPEGFADSLESALEKFVVVKMSNGKKLQYNKDHWIFLLLKMKEQHTLTQNYNTQQHHKFYNSLLKLTVTCQKVIS